MNPLLDKLLPYPFQRLAELKHGIVPPAELPPIALSIGEPRHPTPAVITEALIEHLHGLASYPTTRGVTALRQSIADWLTRRFQLPAGSIDIEHQVLPVSGTREALFSFAQAVMDGRPGAIGVMPNPFYQIYEGAVILAGAEPWYVNAGDGTGLLPDLGSVPTDVWQRCQLLYLCSPGNPTGAVMGTHELQHAIRLADEYDFVIASDECYSEIYFDEQQPPTGLLHAALTMGRTGFERCVVFHSLSKRSNAPGLRSGFVAGDASILDRYFLYRTYHGCTLSPAVQAASIRAWQDEAHVRHNRELYRQKFERVLEVLDSVMDLRRPDAGFYLWAPVPGDDTVFARDLFASQNVTVLPGSYLSRTAGGINPGAGYVRMALVAELDSCLEAAHRIRRFLQQG